MRIRPRALLEGVRKFGCERGLLFDLDCDDDDTDDCGGLPAALESWLFSLSTLLEDFGCCGSWSGLELVSGLERDKVSE